MKNAEFFGSPPLYSLLPLRVKTHIFKMRLVVAWGGFLFYCTTQHIKQLKDFFINRWSLMHFKLVEKKQLYQNTMCSLSYTYDIK